MIEHNIIYCYIPSFVLLICSYCCARSNTVYCKIILRFCKTFFFSAPLTGTISIVLISIVSRELWAGYDYWTGGLNPGLLWIWANSARPVVPKDSTRPEDQITGPGRCLRLTPNAATKVYAYSGAECSNRHRYVCKHEENATDKALTRIHKALKDGSRQQKPLSLLQITSTVQS